MPTAVATRPARNAVAGSGVPRRRLSTRFSRSTTSPSARFTNVVDTIPSATRPGT